MHFFSRTGAAVAVIAAAFVFMLTGCGEKTDLFAYTRGAAEFTLIFPSVSGDTETVTCACTRDDAGNITLTAADPPRLAGFTVEIRDGSVTCGADGTVIPLSQEAAAGLTDIFAVLTEEGSPKKSPDGMSTIITAPTGTVILNEALFPTEIEINERKIGIEWGR